MNEILKQRLVGALILVALGVVFWPIIFVEPGAKSLGEAAQIPARPIVDTTPIIPPGKEGLRPSPELALTREDQKLEEAPLSADDEVAQIPEAVEKAPLPAPKTTHTGPKTQAKAPVVKAAPKRHAPRTEAPAKPALDADGVPIAWILQVASVRSPEKAEELRRRLVDMGYQGYIKKIKSGNSVLLRVYVGPKFERARLESIQPRVDAQFKVKSMVRRYIP